MKCICGKDIEPERLEYGLNVCKACAFAGRGQKKYKGAMIFDHKLVVNVKLCLGKTLRIIVD